MPSHVLTEPQVQEFMQDGYLILSSLFDEEEIGILQQACKLDPAFQKHAHGLDDGEGGVSRLTLWNQAGEDIYGAFARCERVVNAMEQLLGEEVYHWHSKMSIKEPYKGGAWTWHQDYGYWYLDGCLSPDLASIYIAVDRCSKENGCIQALRGSHRLGRVEHGRFGDQTGADPERTDAAMQRLELVYAELEAGDAFIFHSNTLHRSDQNTSPHPRWGLICCYNTRTNNPYKTSHHPFYEPLVKVPDAAIKEMGTKLFPDDTHFWNPSQDATVGEGKG
ncbi:MAG: phytanoyl-CoA dioxygenase family protein [Armatimonadetes bacterium]|nr:phytanoyl-CoA dioxygenase family protein [Armatimonadota bacterium]